MLVGVNKSLNLKIYVVVGDRVIKITIFPNFPPWGFTLVCSIFRQFADDVSSPYIERDKTYS